MWTGTYNFLCIGEYVLTEIVWLIMNKMQLTLVTETLDRIALLKSIQAPQTVHNTLVMKILKGYNL